MDLIEMLGLKPRCETNQCAMENWTASRGGSLHRSTFIVNTWYRKGQ